MHDTGTALFYCGRCVERGETWWCVRGDRGDSVRDLGVVGGRRLHDGELGTWSTAGRGYVASKNHSPGKKILHRETIKIKLNGTIVIDSEFPNRNKIFDNVRNDKNIIEI
jgi:hypothetical protein